LKNRTEVKLKETSSAKDSLSALLTDAKDTAMQKRKQSFIR
jgi:hypothetical protein